MRRKGGPHRPLAPSRSAIYSHAPERTKNESGVRRGGGGGAVDGGVARRGAGAVRPTEKPRKGRLRRPVWTGTATATADAAEAEAERRARWLSRSGELLLSAGRGAPCASGVSLWMSSIQNEN
jgi:hypothetical protein